MANAVVPLNKLGSLTRRDPARLKLFARTVGKHLNPAELDVALEYCELYGANPFSRDIYFFVFSADDPEKRNMVPVLGIGLYRKIAARSGNYRPDDRPARFTYDEGLISPANPKGIVDCEVTVYRHAHGEWFPITERLRWEERAPLVEGGEFEWVDDPSGAVNPPGHKFAGRPKRFKRKKEGGAGGLMLDPSKKQWHSMPETLISKCTEASAIRKGWPNELSGSYVEGELDRGEVIELTATEVLEKTEQEDRVARIGGLNNLVVDWGDGQEIDRVPAGQFYDRVTQWFDKQEAAECLSMIPMWASRNRRTLQEYWAIEKDAALKLKKRVEAVEKRLASEETSL